MIKNPVFKAIPLLARHEGRWRGTYRFIRPDMSLIDQYDFEILVEFPTGEGCDYRQTSHYRWPNGKTQDVMFEGQCKGERLVWDTARISGAMWAVDETTLYLNFHMKQDPDLKVFEMIQLSSCSEKRARTWHWLRGGTLEKITLVDEQRV